MAKLIERITDFTGGVNPYDRATTSPQSFFMSWNWEDNVDSAETKNKMVRVPNSVISNSSSEFVNYCLVRTGSSDELTLWALNNQVGIDNTNLIKITGLGRGESVVYKSYSVTNTGDGDDLYSVDEDTFMVQLGDYIYFMGKESETGGSQQYQINISTGNEGDYEEFTGIPAVSPRAYPVTALKHTADSTIYYANRGVVASWDGTTGATDANLISYNDETTCIGEHGGLIVVGLQKTDGNSYVAIWNRLTAGDTSETTFVNVGQGKVEKLFSINGGLYAMVNEASNNRAGVSNISFHLIQGSNQVTPPSLSKKIVEYKFYDVDVKPNQDIVEPSKFFWNMGASVSFAGEVDSFNGIYSFDGKKLNLEVTGDSSSASTPVAGRDISSFAKVGDDWYYTSANEASSQFSHQRYSNVEWESGDFDTAGFTAGKLTRTIDFGVPSQRKQIDSIKIHFSRVSTENVGISSKYHPLDPATMRVYYRRPEKVTDDWIHIRTVTFDSTDGRMVEITRDSINNKNLPFFKGVQIAVVVDQPAILNEIELEASTIEDSAK